MTEYYVGWDVGAWHCDDNPASRDALAVIYRQPNFCWKRKIFTGSFRSDLVTHEGAKLILTMMQCSGMTLGLDDSITLAIDTPLGWPEEMVTLVAKGTLASHPVDDHGSNPFLFRAQEIALFGDGHRPLSPVEQMIGSQSTKGIYFLQRAGLTQADKEGDEGVWRAQGTPKITALETYPAAVVRNDSAYATSAQKLAPESQPGDDEWDACVCALIAFRYATDKSALISPDGATWQRSEGWMWLPKRRDHDVVILTDLRDQSADKRKEDAKKLRKRAAQLAVSLRSASQKAQGRHLAVFQLTGNQEEEIKKESKRSRFTVTLDAQTLSDCTFAVRSRCSKSSERLGGDEVLKWLEDHMRQAPGGHPATA